MDEPIANIEPKLWNAIQTMTRSKSEVRGTSKLDDPTSQAHTELSLPQDYEPHRSLPQTAGRTDLSLPQDYGPHRSLPQTAGRTDLSLTQTTGRTELSLPQDYGLHSSLSPSRLWAAQISPSDCWLHRALSPSRLRAAQSYLSLRLLTAQSSLSLIPSYIMYTPLEALYMTQHACSTTAQPTYHKTVLSRTKGQIICSEETILAAELHQETRQHSSYYTKVCIHQV